MPRDRQAAKGGNIRGAASSCPPQKEEDRQRRPVTGLAVGGARNCACCRYRFSASWSLRPPCGDLLNYAKDLFVEARIRGCSHHTLSATASGSVGSQSFETARLRAISTAVLTASSRLSV